MNYGYLSKSDKGSIGLVMRKARSGTHFEIDAGFSIKFEIHKANLPNYCAPELITSLEEGDEIECVIISKKLLRKYDLAWLLAEIERRKGCLKAYNNSRLNGTTKCR